MSVTPKLTGFPAQDRGQPCATIDRMGISVIGKTVGLFTLTAFAEIFGCYAAFMWLRQSRSVWWLVPGAASLVVFAWLLTLHPEDGAGRIYAAYGGVYVASALVWLWVVEHRTPDRWDLIGATVCLAGMGIILFGPRPH